MQDFVLDYENVDRLISDLPFRGVKEAVYTLFNLHALTIWRLFLVCRQADDSCRREVDWIPSEEEDDERFLGGVMSNHDICIYMCYL